MKSFCEGAAAQLPALIDWQRRDAPNVLGRLPCGESRGGKCEEFFRWRIGDDAGDGLFPAHGARHAEDDTFADGRMLAENGFEFGGV